MRLGLRLGLYLHPTVHVPPRIIGMRVGVGRVYNGHLGCDGDGAAAV